MEQRGGLGQEVSGQQSSCSLGLRPLIIVEETALRKLLLEAVFLGRQERTYRRRKSAEGKSQQYDTIFRVSRSSGRVSVEETDRQVFQSPSGKLLRTSFPDEFS